MNPAWVMVAIAAGGMVFQAGIGWAVIGRFNKLEKKVDEHADGLASVKTAQVQHEWRITSHDQRLHEHDKQIDVLRNLR